MMKKKLVLVYPNLRWHKVDIQTLWNLNPSVLCLLGTMVEDDVEVTIIDAQFYDLSVEEFTARIKEIQPDYVGISVLTSEYATILHRTAAAVKSVSPTAVVIAGGVHVTIEYMQVMDDLNIDFAVRGEGEYVFQALIRHLNGSGDAPAEGLVCREHGAIKAGPQALVADLSALPTPNYELVRMEDYVKVGGRYGPLRPPEYPYVRMVITRGCPVGCSFCQVEALSGKKVRSPRPEQVVDELQYFKDRHGIKSFLIDDDNLVIKKKFFKAFLRELIARDLNLKFLIQAFAIFSLDDEMLDLMKRAGCDGINVAIESGNQRVMNDIVLKPLVLASVLPLIAKVKAKGIFVLANFIIGFPGETWQEIRETVHFAETSGADYIKLFVAVPLKGTRLWDLADKLDAFDTPIDEVEVDWRFSQIKSDDWSSKDVSILRAYEWDRINFRDAESRRRVAEIWGMSDDEIAVIRKATRDAVTMSGGAEVLDTRPSFKGDEAQRIRLRTDGGNLLIN